MRAWMWAIAALAGLLPAAAPAAEIRLYNWNDYIAPEVVERFERETGHKIVVVTYASNEEMYQAVKASRGAFDLIVPDQHMVQRMIREGLLEKIDAPSLPGFYNLESAWISGAHDPNDQYSVPYLCGTTSFAVDTAALPNATGSLATFFAPPPAAHGKVGAFGELVEVYGLAAIYLGLSPCTDKRDEQQRIETLLKTLKLNVTGFYAEKLVDSIADPKHLIHMAWNGDVLRARLQRPTLAYAYPREGILAWLSALAVPKNAPHKAAALQFVSYLLRPEIAAMQTNYTGFANAVQGSSAFLKPEFQNAPEFNILPGAKIHFLKACAPAVAKRQQEIMARIAE